MQTHWETEKQAFRDEIDRLAENVGRLSHRIEGLEATLRWYASAGDYEKAIDCGARAKSALMPEKRP